MGEHGARPTFRTTGWLRVGYATEDVDDFVDEVFVAIAAGRPTPDIAGARFRPTRGGGYAMEEVDAFLDDLAAGLAGPAAT